MFIISVNNTCSSSKLYPVTYDVSSAAQTKWTILCLENLSYAYLSSYI